MEKEFRFGDIVIAAFPFTEGEQTKPRPALVLTFDADKDVLLARITSQHYSEAGDVSLHGWENLGLLFPSTLRLSKLVTLKSERVRRLIGQLTREGRQNVVGALHEFVDSLEKI